MQIAGAKPKARNSDCPRLLEPCCSVVGLQRRLESKCSKSQLQRYRAFGVQGRREAGFDNVPFSSRRWRLAELSIALSFTVRQRDARRG